MYEGRVERPIQNKEDLSATCKLHAIQVFVYHHWEQERGCAYWERGCAYWEQGCAYMYCNVGRTVLD